MFLFLDDHGGFTSPLLKATDKDRKSNYIVSELKQQSPFKSLIPYKSYTLTNEKIQNLYPFWIQPGTLNIKYIIFLFVFSLIYYKYQAVKTLLDEITFSLQF